MKSIKNICSSILKIFKKEPILEIIDIPPNITINDLKMFDDIYVKINSNVYKGWVINKTVNIVAICYEGDDKKLHEMSFNIKGLYSETIVTNMGNSLILNKKDVNA